MFINAWSYRTVFLYFLLMQGMVHQQDVTAPPASFTTSFTDGSASTSLVSPPTYITLASTPVCTDAFTGMQLQYNLEMDATSAACSMGEDASLTRPRLLLTPVTQLLTWMYQNMTYVYTAADPSSGVAPIPTEAPISVTDWDSMVQNGTAQKLKAAAAYSIFGYSVSSTGGLLQPQLAVHPLTLMASDSAVDRTAGCILHGADGVLAAVSALSAEVTRLLQQLGAGSPGCPTLGGRVSGSDMRAMNQLQRHRATMFVCSGRLCILVEGPGSALD